jgi:hypothetical protein
LKFFSIGFMSNKSRTLLPWSQCWLHCTTNVVSLNPAQARCARYNIMWFVTFVIDLWQIGGFLQVLWFPPPIKLTNISEILLKVALSTINLTLTDYIVSPGKLKVRIWSVKLTKGDKCIKYNNLLFWHLH